MLHRLQPRLHRFQRALSLRQPTLVAEWYCTSIETGRYLNRTPWGTSSTAGNAGSPADAGLPGFLGWDSGGQGPTRAINVCVVVQLRD